MYLRYYLDADGKRVYTMKVNKYLANELYDLVGRSRGELYTFCTSW